MNQPGNNLSINEDTSIKETRPPSDLHNEQTGPIDSHLVVEPTSSGAAPASAGASSEPQDQVPEMISGDIERDAFFAAMEDDLPAGYVWCPEDSRIHKSDDGKDPMPFCGPIRIVRYLRTSEGENWSWEIAFLDRDGNLRHEIVSIAETNASPASLGNRLTGRGFDLLAKGPDLCKFLASWHVEDRGWIVTQSGWVETPTEKGANPSAYVQPDGTIHLAKAAADLSIRYSGIKSEGGKVGSLVGWQNSVAALASGNPALIFSICVALCGPMLRFAGIDTMGFNFFARTSSGKTHALKVAASCGNDPDTILQWNGTPSGLAAITAAANDRTLLLDEFPHNPGNEVSEALYSIGNGTGRIVANRKVERWRVALLSTSEKNLPEMFATSRRSMPDGLRMRLLDIPARSWTYGIIDELHGHSDGHTFLVSLSQACRENHGHVLPGFVDFILRQDENFTKVLLSIMAKFRREILKTLGLSELTASGQVQRAVERFALVAAVGEIAIFKGLLPWPGRAASTAATDIAQLWFGAFIARPLAAKSGPTGEMCAWIAENIEQFIDLEAARHTGAELGPGWKDSTFIYLRGEALSAEILNGETIREVAQRLDDAGILARGSEARSFQYRMPESLVRSRPRVYRLRRAEMTE